MSGYLDPTPRFSDAEMRDISDCVIPLICSGRWHRAERQTGEQYDRVLVYVSCKDPEHYRVKRDITGWTYLLWCTSINETELLIVGSLSEFLDRLVPRPIIIEDDQ
jgi:hypothetical protein